MPRTKTRPAPAGEYLTYHEVAAELGRLMGRPCSPEWVRQLGRRGLLAVTKFGTRTHRVHRSALKTYLSTTTGATRGEVESQGQA